MSVEPVVERPAQGAGHGPSDKPFVDWRDVAEFDVHLLERDTGGTFNAAGPTMDEYTMEQFVYGIRAITNARVSFSWVDGAFLRERQIRHPLWFSQNTELKGACRVRSHRGVAAGLKFRPLAVSALDTLEWFNSESQEFRGELDLHLDRDREALEAWRASGSGESRR